MHHGRMSRCGLQSRAVRDSLLPFPFAFPSAYTAVLHVKTAIHL